MSWSQAELDGLMRAFATGTLKVSDDGKSLEYGSAAGFKEAIAEAKGKHIRRLRTTTSKELSWANNGPASAIDAASRLG